MSVIDDMQTGTWPADATDPNVQAALDSIGADSTIISIPGLPPILTEAGDVVGILYQIAAIISAITAEVSYIPIVNVILLIINLVLLLFSLFAGRPRQQATLNCATNLLKAKNSAAILAGNSIYRLFNEYNIVISASGTEQYLIGAVVAQFVNNLVGQGIELTLARQIVLFQFTNGADNLGQIWPFLQETVEPGTQTFGPQGLERVFNIVLAHYLALGQTEEKAEEHTWQDLLKYLPIKWLWQVYLGSQPGQPPPGTCKPGYHWAPQANNGEGACVKNFSKLPPPITWQPPVGTPPLGQPDPDGDEITRDLCQQNANNALAVIYTLNQLLEQMQQPADDTCCTAITDAISAVSAAISAIAAALPGLAPAPPTVTVNSPVTVNVPPAPPPEITVNAPPTDVSQIVGKLAEIFGTIDTPLSLYTKLVGDGYLDPNYTQFFGQGATAPAGVTAAFTRDWDMIRNLVKRWVGTDIGPPGKDPSAPPGGLAQLSGSLQTYLKTTDKVIAPVLQPLIETVVSQLKPTGTPAIGSAGVNPDTPVASAISVALTAGIVGWLVSFLGIDAGEPLAHIAELIAGAIGFEELRDVVIAPLVRNGIAKVADLQAKALFQQELPGAGAAAGWVARGLMPQAQANQLMTFAGLHNTLQPIEQRAAYRGMNARQLLRLIETNLFTQAEIQDELTFAGVRGVSQTRMFHAAPYLATATYRSQLHSALYSAYEAGLLADADLTSAVDSAESNFDRDNLILTAMHYRTLTLETKKLEAEYANMFKVGVIDDPTYRADLQQLGLQPWYINIIAGATEAAANAASYQKNIKEAAAIARATANDERKAAMQAFKSGKLNAAGLTLALAATGLTANQVAARVSQAQLAQLGSLRIVYGLELAPAAATLLKQRVTDISDQIKAGLIKPAAAIPMLTALKIPSNWQNAILSAAAASIAAKAAAIDIPVQTG